MAVLYHRISALSKVAAALFPSQCSIAATNLALARALLSPGQSSSHHGLTCETKKIWMRNEGLEVTGQGYKKERVVAGVDRRR
ncbi:hypothetical protein M0R45_026456 [Rubus argutus]|uniref:Uncharacterized protein n=1 Tax=Rubus argutus TaxID=59490 RepID=A0AAW1WZW5_RUBAR